MSLLSKVLAPKFFEVVRTQQQLGYIVSLGSQSSAKFTYLFAVVQTEFPPDFTRSRIDAFLDDHWTFVEEKLDEDEFQTCRAGLLSELKIRPKNLSEEMGQYSKEFNERTYNFHRREECISFLEATATLDG